MINDKGKRLFGREIIDLLYVYDWFYHDDDPKILVRYYSISSIDLDQIKDFDPKPANMKICDIPFKLALCRISKQEYNSHFPWHVSTLEGKPDFVVEEIKRELPESFYLLISTPINKDHIEGYEIASVWINRLTGCLRSIVGNNLLRGPVREASIEINTGNMRSLTSAIPLPKKFEGPFIAQENWTEIDDILRGIEECDKDRRNRILLGLEFFERAANEKPLNRFFNYWIAIEVICGIHSPGKIQTKLTKAYNKNRSFIQNELAFDRLKKMRTDLFHKGLMHDLPPDVERYIQATVLDILREEIGLPCQRHMQLQVEGGFDVKRLDRTVGKINISTINGP